MLFPHIFPLLLISAFSLLPFSNAATFNIGGTLFCATAESEQSGDQNGSGGPFLAGAKVELWEDDRGRDATIDSDDKLISSFSNEKGRFEVKGSSLEVGSSEPYLLIEHHCPDQTKQPPKSNCHYESRIDLWDHLDNDDNIKNLLVYLGLNYAIGNEKKELKVDTKLVCK